MSALTRKRSRRRRNQSGADVDLVVHTQDGEMTHAMTPPITEAVRYFLARLQMNGNDGVPRRLGLTSALSGEGVSFTARSLASIMARDLERSVCLIDLNWWDRQWQSPQQAEHAALVDLVRGTAHLSDVLRPTSIPDLSLISAGRLGRDRRHAMAESDELAAALDEIATNFDHLILDLPAVLRTSATLPLARRCDAFALVVRQGVTSEFQITSALDELRSVASVGVILNGTVTRTPQRLQRLLGF